MTRAASCGTSSRPPGDPGVHLHRGARGATSPCFHGLQVQLNADRRRGIFFGTAILTDDRRKALLAGETYVDIHTQQYGPREVRDQWRPLDAAAAARALEGTDGTAVLPVANAMPGTSCH